MARQDFIENLRMASRMLPLPRENGGQGPQTEAYESSSSLMRSHELWFNERFLQGFDPRDFADWPKDERDRLAKEVAAFRAIAERVPANTPATKTQSKQAWRRLERAIQIVGKHLLDEWLLAQERMLDEAKAAAKANGWYVEQDEKEVVESLLGAYKAPRLRIRALDREAVLNPIAYFGSGRRGVVDLVVLPTYETAYFLTFKNGEWKIVSPNGAQNKRPFTRETFASTFSRLPTR
jgi:hypothetical protein